MPHLGLEVLSGGTGLGRPVSWTHTSDLPEPWRWITGGELLMTNGLSFPKTAAEQETLLTKLDESGVAGLAIGEKMYCPRLTQRFTRRSDRLGFPVLRIRYPLPFVAISRAVAEATLVDQSSRLSRTVRIYDVLRRHIGSASPQLIWSPRWPASWVANCTSATGVPVIRGSRRHRRSTRICAMRSSSCRSTPPTWRPACTDCPARVRSRRCSPTSSATPRRRWW